MANTEISLMEQGFVHMEGFSSFYKAGQAAEKYKSFGYEVAFHTEKIGKRTWYSVWVRRKEVRA